MVSADSWPHEGQVIVETSCIYLPLNIFNKTGSMWVQFAASIAMSVAHRSRTNVVPDRCGDMRAELEAQEAGRFQNHAPHPPTMAKVLSARSGSRHSATISRPPRTVALAPRAARPSGTTQHDEATTVPSPANSPSAASHFGVAGFKGGASVCVTFCAARSTVMGRLSLTVDLSCTL